MLEILFLRWFVGHLSGIAKGKGRHGIWGGLGAVFWLGGEITGFIVGAIATDGKLDFGAYILALLFAATGAAMAFGIVKLLPAVNAPYVPSANPYVSNGPPADLSNPYAPPRVGP